MVQVHAAHGWLFSQFLSPVLNRREDEFGGSLENRARFLLLALDAVRQGVGPRFPIEIRISGDDLTDIGLNMDECVQVAKLVEDKVDLYNVSCGNHEDPDMFCRTHPFAFYPRGVNVYLAANIKKHVSKPVACVGSLNDPAQMVGGEAAVSFHHEGKDVSIIEMKDGIALEVNSFYRGGLMPEIKKSATCYTGTRVMKIVPEGVLVQKDGREFVIEADSVVCALGFRAPLRCGGRTLQRGG